MASRVDAEIRLLTEADLEGAMLLSSTAGWNQRLADWRMLLQLAPLGGYTAVASGRIVGTAIGIDYGSFGWIAMMLVDPAYRGHGLGARLLDASLAALPADRPVRLDATPMGRPLYQRFGFEDESRLTRHVAEATRAPAAPAPEPSVTVRRLAPEDLDLVANVDRTAFSADRASVLEWMLEGAPEYAQLIETDDGPQYCFGRQGRLFDQIGPLVATSDDLAQALIVSAIRAAQGRAVAADLFDVRGAFAERLRRHGFSAQRPLFRMCKPGRPSNASKVTGGMEYLILGPEFA